MELTDMLIKEGSTNKLPKYNGEAFIWDNRDTSIRELPFSQQELLGIAYLTYIRRKVVKSGFSFIGSFDGIHRCLAAGNKVLLADGSWKNVEDIKCGDKVLSPQLDNSIICANVIATNSYFEKEVYNVIEPKLGHKILYTCSKDHRIPIIDEGYKEHTAEYISTLKHEVITPALKLYNVSIKCVKTKPQMVYGFTLDSPSGLFITNDWLITHNSGKSLTATTWGYLWDKTFWEDYPNRLVKEPREFVDEIERIAHRRIDGAVIQIDEAGVTVSSADWYERWMKTVFKMVQMFGYLHPIILFTAPVKDFIDARLRKMFNAHYNINRFTLKECIITPYHMKYSSVMSKTYHKKPVLRIAGQHITLRRIQFGMPPSFIVDRYEELSESRKDKMLGKFKQDMIKSEIKEQRQAPDIKDLVKHVANNWKIFEAARSTPDKPKLNTNAIEYTLKIPNRQATYVRDEAEKIIHKHIREEMKKLEEMEEKK